MPRRTMLSQLIGLTGARRSAGCMVRSLVFAFPVVPRNYTWFDAANNRGLAPRTASDFALRTFCEVGNPSRCQGLVPCTHHPWQKLPYTVTRFCLLPQEQVVGPATAVDNSLKQKKKPPQEGGLTPLPKRQTQTFLIGKELKTKDLQYTAAERASEPTTKSTPKTRIKPRIVWFRSVMPSPVWTARKEIEWWSLGLAICGLLTDAN